MSNPQRMAAYLDEIDRLSARVRKLEGALGKAESDLWNIANAWNDEDYRGPVAGLNGPVIAHRQEFVEAMINSIVKSAEAARAALNPQQGGE